MRESFPRIRLFVPCTASSLDECSAALAREGLSLRGDLLIGHRVEAPVEVEWVENDGGFGQAFSLGTVEQDDLAAIDAAPGALVLYCHKDLREARVAVCDLVAQLGRAGALAVRLEQSNVGWSIAHWLKLMSSDDPWAWHRAAVAFITDDGVLQSCGMHAFSLPDVRAELDDDRASLNEFLGALNVYQLAEDPVLRSGHTFAPDAQTSRRVLERWPDTMYPSGHAAHNPYGVFRLGPPGSSGRAQSELTHVFMPSLRAVLLAHEKKNGRPLTREDVEATRDAATCIAMTPRDAQMLERSRGYADLDPELAWVQWQAASTPSAG